MGHYSKLWQHSQVENAHGTSAKVEASLPSCVYGILVQLLYDPSQEFVGVLVILRLWSLLHLHATSNHKGIRIHGGEILAGSSRVESGSGGTMAGNSDGGSECVEHAPAGRCLSRKQGQQGGAFVRGRRRARVTRVVE